MALEDKQIRFVPWPTRQTNHSFCGLQYKQIRLILWPTRQTYQTHYVAYETNRSDSFHGLQDKSYKASSFLDITKAKYHVLQHSLVLCSCYNTRTRTRTRTRTHTFTHVQFPFSFSLPHIGLCIVYVPHCLLLL